MEPLSTSATSQSSASRLLSRRSFANSGIPSVTGQQIPSGSLETHSPPSLSPPSRSPGSNFRLAAKTLDPTVEAFQPSVSAPTSCWGSKIPASTHGAASGSGSLGSWGVLGNKRSFSSDEDEGALQFEMEGDPTPTTNAPSSGRGLDAIRRGLQALRMTGDSTIIPEDEGGYFLDGGLLADPTEDFLNPTQPQSRKQSLLGGPSPGRISLPPTPDFGPQMLSTSYGSNFSHKTLTNPSPPAYGTTPSPGSTTAYLATTPGGSIQHRPLDSPGSAYNMHPAAAAFASGSGGYPFPPTPFTSMSTSSTRSSSWTAGFQGPSTTTPRGTPPGARGVIPPGVLMPSPSSSHPTVGGPKSAGVPMGVGVGLGVGAGVGLMTAHVAADGCPVLQVPRLPFWGTEGQMAIAHRHWKKGGTEKADNRHFMVMSWNVEGATKDDGGGMSKVLDEIAFYSPDFVCLQDIALQDFQTTFLPRLQKIGYEGHFQQQKSTTSETTHQIGLATFHLETRFSIQSLHWFAYADMIPADPTSDLHTLLSPLPNIALVAVYQNRNARSLRVRLVNTHLLKDLGGALDIKLLQSSLLMDWLERNQRDIPTVIAGDLGSKAGEPVVDYLVRGKVVVGPWCGHPMGAAPGTHASMQQQQQQQQQQQVSGDGSNLASGAPKGVMQNTMNVPTATMPHGFPTLVRPNPVPSPQPAPLLRHGTKLASAYDRKDLPYTTKTSSFEGCVDHILYTSGTLSIRDVLADFEGSAYVSTLIPAPLPLAVLQGSAMTTPSVGSGPSTNPTDASADQTTNHPTDPHPQPPQMVYAPPTHHGYLSQIPHLPTPHIPTTHLPLCAWLKWKTVPVGTLPPNLQTPAGTTQNALRRPPPALAQGQGGGGTQQQGMGGGGGGGSGNAGGGVRKPQQGVSGPGVLPASVAMVAAVLGHKSGGSGGGYGTVGSMGVSGKPPAGPGGMGRGGAGKGWGR
ncbi:Glucose-repressible alcohol dehydrogenase transcriptional effector [Chytridiales sp. JEL 0842]|nr:Glucose-repressible alcohol dehydrogenase transcriptional effector [Chytridiales sp. JEL 0842]